MGLVSSLSRNQTIPMQAWMLSVCTKINHLSLDLMTRQTRKPKFLITSQTYGWKEQIFLSVLGTGKYMGLHIRAISRLFSICFYATTHTDESVYIIGGWTGDSYTGSRTSVIAEYKNENWSNVGSLKQARKGSTHHRQSIVRDNRPNGTWIPEQDMFMVLSHLVHWPWWLEVLQPIHNRKFSK